MSSRRERLLDLTERTIAHGVEMRIGRLHTEDDRLDGSTMTVDGAKLVDFGSCSYLALNRDERLKDAARDGIERFGTSHSSSPMYTSIGLYADLEEKLGRILGASVAIAPTTTLAHLAALPALVRSDDLVLLDQFSHASLRLAADVLRGQGIRVEFVRHNDVDALRKRLERCSDDFTNLWYAADGLYSMFGDFAPVREIEPLLGEFPNLHLYYDEAHSLGWAGRHGRGHVLEHVPWHPRMVLVAGLSKSFAANGAVLAFGDPAMRQRVVYTGSSFTFSGPVQIASLAAAVASADIHLSEEHASLQGSLNKRIDLARELLLEHGLPVQRQDQSPIWFIRVGKVDAAIRLVRDLMDDGFYVNPAGYPAVPIGSAGIRFTQTLHHSEEDLRGLIAAIVRRIPAPEPEIIIDLTDSAAATIPTETTDSDHTDT
ncbi:MAG: aminotransferase class I/II-fold pyridoxal phosphate-dependent enzyme [Acidimicrobiia bacterium]|nr:aminotransferase class I/II-fold pyridoxal phosphate-dependent enzyme [Acidimicrobiia bacterium]